MRRVLALIISLCIFTFIIPVGHLFCPDTASSTASEHHGNSHTNPGHQQNPASPCKALSPASHSCCNLIFQSSASFSSLSSFSLFVPNETLSFPSEIPQNIF